MPQQLPQGAVRPPAVDLWPSWSVVLPRPEGEPPVMEAASVKRKRLKKMNRHKQRKLRRRERNKN